MKLKEYFSISKNSTNKQVNWNLKKKKLKESRIKEEDLLNIEIDDYLKRCIK